MRRLKNIYKGIVSEIKNHDLEIAGFIYELNK